MEKRSNFLTVQKLLDSSISVSLFAFPSPPELNTFILGLQGPSGGLISCLALSVLHSNYHSSTHSLACRILLICLFSYSFFSSHCICGFTPLLLQHYCHFRGKQTYMGVLIPHIYPKIPLFCQLVCTSSWWLLL